MEDNITAVWQGRQVALPLDVRQHYKILSGGAFRAPSMIVIDSEPSPQAHLSAVTWGGEVAYIAPSAPLIDWMSREWGVFDWKVLVRGVNRELIGSGARTTSAPAPASREDDEDDYPEPPQLIF